MVRFCWQLPRDAQAQIERANRFLFANALSSGSTAPTTPSAFIFKCDFHCRNCFPQTVFAHFSSFTLRSWNTCSRMSIEHLKFRLWQRRSDFVGHCIAVYGWCGQGILWNAVNITWFRLQHIVDYYSGISSSRDTQPILCVINSDDASLEFECRTALSSPNPSRKPRNGFSLMRSCASDSLNRIWVRHILSTFWEKRLDAIRKSGLFLRIVCTYRQMDFR